MPPTGKSTCCCARGCGPLGLLVLGQPSSACAMNDARMSRKRGVCSVPCVPRGMRAPLLACPPMPVHARGAPGLGWARAEAKGGHGSHLQSSPAHCGRASLPLRRVVHLPAAHRTGLRCGHNDMDGFRRAHSRWSLLPSPTPLSCGIAWRVCSTRRMRTNLSASVLMSCRGRWRRHASAHAQAQTSTC